MPGVARAKSEKQKRRTYQRTSDCIFIGVDRHPRHPTWFLLMRQNTLIIFPLLFPLYFSYSLHEGAIRRYCRRVRPCMDAGENIACMQPEMGTKFQIIPPLLYIIFNKK
jgi:hypothetical protein